MRRILPLLGLLVLAGCGPARSIKVSVLSASADGVGIHRNRFGTDYASGFQAQGGCLTFRPKIEVAGVYEIFLRHRTPAGGKGYELTVNGVGCDGFFPASPSRFRRHAAGRVWLPAGESVFSLGGGWGHYEIGSLTLERSAPFPKPRAVPSSPVNPQASPEARALLARLATRYGHATFGGAMGQKDMERVNAVAGTPPALAAGDLMDDSPSRNEFGLPQGLEVERMLAAAAQGHLITLCWHWNAPTNLINQAVHTNEAGVVVEAHWYSGFYTRATTFDFAAALADRDGAEYRLLLRDIDAIAVQLRRLQDAGVPVLWRPLHEADGTWFWWGAKGPDAFKALWRLLYDRLVAHHGLNHLLWVYTWSDPAWYPGDDVVDLVGLDLYPSRADDLMSGSWERALAAFDGRKMIALSELGSAPNLADQWDLGIRWAYFVPWLDRLADAGETEIRAAYLHPAVIGETGATD